MPMDIGMAIAQNKRALRVFREMSGDDRARVIERAETMAARGKLREYICKLADGDMS